MFNRRALQRLERWMNRTSLSSFLYRKSSKRSNHLEIVWWSYRQESHSRIFTSLQFDMTHVLTGIYLSSIWVGIWNNNFASPAHLVSPWGDLIGFATCVILFASSWNSPRRHCRGRDIAARPFGLHAMHVVINTNGIDAWKIFLYQAISDDAFRFCFQRKNQKNVIAQESSASKLFVLVKLRINFFKEHWMWSSIKKYLALFRISLETCEIMYKTSHSCCAFILSAL